MNEAFQKNPYTASTFNYSVKDKKFTERLITYITDFIVHDDPSFTKNKCDSDYWKKFVSDSTNLKKMSAKQKMDSGRYLYLHETDTKMMKGFSQHKIAFWNFTSDAATIQTNNHKHRNCHNRK